MGIIFHEKTKVFHLQNSSISYLMMVLPNGQMGHLYFGKRFWKSVKMFPAAFPISFPLPVIAP